MNKQVRASAIFLLIGALLLLTAFLLQRDGFFSSILSNVAIVVLTVVILNFLWNLLGGEPIANSLEQLTGSLQHSFQRVDDKLQQSFQIIQDSHLTGLVAISTNGTLTRTQWLERLRNAQQCIDLMGYTLLRWGKTPRFSEEVLKLVQRDVKIRVLIMDETNSHFDCFINEDIAGSTIDQTRKQLEVAQKVFEGLQQKVQAANHANLLGSFELRTVKKGLITCNICRTDTQMAVVNYLYWQQTTNSPLMLLQQNNDQVNLFQMYQDEFDQLWDLNG
jgi:hypothetical protein